MSTPHPQASASRDRSSLLRAALRGNALFSAASGLALMVAAPAIAGVLGPVKPVILRLIGAMLLLYAGGLLLNARRPAVNRAEAVTAIVLDAAWVGASGILLLTGMLSTPGAWIVATVAEIVALFGCLQWVGLRRIARASALRTGVQGT